LSASNTGKAQVLTQRVSHYGIYLADTVTGKKNDFLVLFVKT